MIESAQKINYFRSCFEADNRSPQLYSFYSRKVGHPLFIDDSDLLCGKMPFQLVDSTWGQNSHKTLTLYAKEKQLYLGAFFILGNTIVLNKKQKLIAPLLLYPATLIEEEELFKIELTSNNPILNPAAIQPLTLRDSTKNVLDEVSSILPTGELDFEQAVHFKENLDRLFANLHTETLLDFPNITSAAQFEKLRRGRNLFKSEEEFYLINALGFGVLDKTKSGRGILNELKEIGEKSIEQLSAPLKSLMGPVNTGFKKQSIKNVMVPVILNKAQQNIIRASHENELNIAIGPPGTGKSFTIAALAIDAISRGESVLIASNNNQAVEVIAQKLLKDFELDHPPIKTNHKKWKSQAKEYLKNILNGMGVEAVSYRNLKVLGQQLDEAISESNRQERIIQARTQNEKKWAKSFEQNGSLWNWIRSKWYQKRARMVAPLWKLYKELKYDLALRNELLSRYFTKSRHYYLGLALANKRLELYGFLKALKARTGSLKEDRFNTVDFDSLFQALPIWLVTTHEVHQVLPLRKDLFDLVIFDEATQCNIATAIPILQRGKRAVIAGDPKQLRHISFLSRHRQQQFLQQHNISIAYQEELDYRKLSLLDLALQYLNDSRWIHFLNEHYRSLPDIIGFSNQKFYNSALHLMTDTPTAAKTGNLYLQKVAGKRIGKGHNAIEAQAVLEKVEEIVTADANLSTGLCRSIGVLSPFREQSDYLTKLIGENIPLEAIQKHQILMGTPHFFQGEERDVMLLSFALDENSHPSAFYYLEKKDVFNVSITRARTAQHVFISFDEQKTKGLLREYLTYVLDDMRPPIANSKSFSQDPFLQEVAAFLRNQSNDIVYENYTISGLSIDLVIVRNGKTYCIDLVGYPGLFEKAFPLERINMLDRMHIKVFSLPYLYWKLHPENCVKALNTFLEA